MTEAGLLDVSEAPRRNDEEHAELLLQLCTQTVLHSQRMESRHLHDKSAVES
jgi:hypothetical protein